MVLGAAPAQLGTFRVQAAAATCMTQAQRCATTAIEIVYGLDFSIAIFVGSRWSFLRIMMLIAVVTAAVSGRLRVAWWAANGNPA